MDALLCRRVFEQPVQAPDGHSLRLLPLWVLLGSYGTGDHILSIHRSLSVLTASIVEPFVNPSL